MNKDVMFSSKTDNWATPTEFYNTLNEELHFNLDPCADEFNHKCEKFYTVEQDGLKQDWGGYRVFCNPPYGRDISKWVKKAYNEGHKSNTLVCMLIPARTDTKFFHEYILNRAEIRFIKGRLKFGGSKTTAPFPSMLVVYRAPEM